MEAAKRRELEYELTKDIRAGVVGVIDYSPIFGVRDQLLISLMGIGEQLKIWADDFPDAAKSTDHTHWVEELRRAGDIVEWLEALAEVQKKVEDSAGAESPDSDDDFPGRWSNDPEIDVPETMEDIERLAIRSMSLLSAHFAGLLPEDSAWRKLFAELSESLLEDVEGSSLAKALGRTPAEETATSEDELFVPEEERAAIVAYTGLWQLRECRVRSETPALRAARLELRRRLDASEVADRPEEEEEWTPVSGDQEQELLHEIHTSIRERLPRLDPMSPWGGPMRSIVKSLGNTLGRGADDETRPSDPLFAPEDRERVKAWVALKVYDEVGEHGDAERLLGEVDRWVPLLRNVAGDQPLSDRDMADLRGIITPLRDTYSREAAMDNLPADKEAAAREFEVANRVLAALDAAEKVNVDA